MKIETMVKRAQERVDKFNSKCNVGDAVTVTLDDGEIRDTVTRSEAEVMSATAVIWLKGISGAYDLKRVKRKRA